jgi:ribose 5-phosphate isomerase B
MTIYLGADHNGFEMKAYLRQQLQASGYTVVDEGDKVPNSRDDFPQFAARTVAALKASGDSKALGILICGSGQGMCMAANRHRGIRASLCWSETEARAARNDDDSNVLCLPARYMDNVQAEAIVKVWLTTGFAGAARFKRRIKEMDELGS